MASRALTQTTKQAPESDPPSTPDFSLGRQLLRSILGRIGRWKDCFLSAGIRIHQPTYSRSGRRPRIQLTSPSNLRPTSRRLQSCWRERLFHNCISRN